MNRTSGQSAIHLAINQVNHEKTKHVDVKLHFPKKHWKRETVCIKDWDSRHLKVCSLRLYPLQSLRIVYKGQGSKALELRNEKEICGFIPNIQELESIKN